jgi:hypothetical protein
MQALLPSSTIDVYHVHIEPNHSNMFTLSQLAASKQIKIVNIWGRMGVDIFIPLAKCFTILLIQELIDDYFPSFLLLNTKNRGEFSKRRIF